MTKTKTAYFCQNCGAQSPKWIGKCPACNQWNTYIEEIVQSSSTSSVLYELKDDKRSKPKKISDVKLSDQARIITPNNELNRVLGGGIVKGAVILVGGEPGIGKSTLMLQIALSVNGKVLYVSGEESPEQIKLRADRIKNTNDNCLLLSETSFENVLYYLKHENPDFAIIDSIQTLQTDKIESSAGSVSQIRECTSLLLNYAKKSNTPMFLIGHINKEGSIAGPKVLEHIVDTVLQFEGDRNNMYRILRSAKNRFGSTSELGIFEMQHDGLREVANPSELLLSLHSDDLSGISIGACIEGMRPFMIEVQALVSSAAYGTPQRSATGYDLRRLSMLLAVLEKRAGFRLGVKDVFLNIAGGIKVDDPAMDLAVVCSVLSSDIDIAVKTDICMAGEVGLSGEIRPVNRVEQRIKEASRLGFKRMYISKHNNCAITIPDFEIKKVSKIEEVFRSLFK